MAGISTSVAGISSKVVTAVMEKVVDTKKYDSPVDKDICMSQINCQPTIVDGNEWVGVTKTKVTVMCKWFVQFSYKCMVKPLCTCTLLCMQMYTYMYMCNKSTSYINRTLKSWHWNLLMQGTFLQLSRQGTG